MPMRSLVLEPMSNPGALCLTMRFSESSASYWKGDNPMAQVSTRITIEPDKRGGKPCIRGLRITVWDVLGWLGAGMTEEQILDEHPDIEKADFPAVYQFAAEAGRRALAE